MKNALVYSVNNDKWNKTYLNQMINSINSFYHHNTPELLKSMRVFVMTDDKRGLDLSKLNPEAKYTVLDLKDMTCDYTKLPIQMAHLKFHTYLRLELFVNPKFKSYDNILYMDCDTEFAMPVDELFKKKDKPTICVVEENQNWLKTNHNIEVKHYFNAGVMLLTPKLIGEDLGRELHGKFLDAAKNNKFLFADQDALNLVLDDEKYQGMMDYIYPGYNAFVGTFIGNRPPTITKIVHHAGNPQNKIYKLSYL